MCGQDDIMPKKEKQRKKEKKRKQRRRKKKKKEKKAATVQRLKSKHCSIGSKLKNNKKIKRLNKPNVYYRGISDFYIANR